MPEHKIAELIYRGSRDGFNRRKFDEKCENISPSFVLIKSKEHQHTFGWFSNIPWQTSGGYKTQGGKSFIFKLLKDGSFNKLKNLDKLLEVYFDD